MEENKFGKALTDLLDETGVFTRAQWASYLYVSTSAISQWVNGKTVPRPDYLVSIISHLERYKKAEVQEKLDNFYLIADLPVGEVMPAELLGRNSGMHTISDYLSSVFMQNLQYDVNILPGRVRKTYTMLCSKISRILQEQLNEDKNGIESKKLEKLLKNINVDELLGILNLSSDKPQKEEPGIGQTTWVNYPDKGISVLRGSAIGFLQPADKKIDYSMD